jgi:hypothetical protein
MLNTNECLRCRSTMEQGFILDRGHHNAASALTWVAGLPEQMRIFGIRMGRVTTRGKDRKELLSFLCPRCGYVELRAASSVRK